MMHTRILTVLCTCLLLISCGKKEFTVGGGASADTLSYHMWQQGDRVTFVVRVNLPDKTSQSAFLLILKVLEPPPTGPNWGGINLNLVRSDETEHAELFELASGKVWAIYEVTHEPFGELFTIANRPYSFDAGRVFLLDFTMPSPDVREPKEVIPETRTVSVTQIDAEVPELTSMEFKDFESAIRQLTAQHKTVREFLR